MRLGFVVHLEKVLHKKIIQNYKNIRLIARTELVLFQEIMSVPEPESALNGRDLLAIFRLWEEQHGAPGYDPVPVLTR